MSALGRFSLLGNRGDDRPWAVDRNAAFGPAGTVDG
jgi:hypothetical protein